MDFKLFDPVKSPQNPRERFLIERFLQPNNAFDSTGNAAAQFRSICREHNPSLFLTSAFTIKPDRKSDTEIRCLFKIKRLTLTDLTELPIHTDICIKNSFSKTHIGVTNGIFLTTWGS